MRRLVARMIRPAWMAGPYDFKQMLGQRSFTAITGNWSTPSFAIAASGYAASSSLL